MKSHATVLAPPAAAATEDRSGEAKLSRAKTAGRKPAVLICWCRPHERAKCDEARSRSRELLGYARIHLKDNAAWLRGGFSRLSTRLHIWPCFLRGRDLLSTHTTAGGRSQFSARIGASVPQSKQYRASICPRTGQYELRCLCRAARANPPGPSPLGPPRSCGHRETWFSPRQFRSGVGTWADGDEPSALLFRHPRCLRRVLPGGTMLNRWKILPTSRCLDGRS